MRRTLAQPLLVLLASLAFADAACNKTSAEPATRADVEPGAVKVETATVEERPMPRYLVLTGQLVANMQSDLAADASGKVLATKIDRGSLVEKGDVLVQLDPRNAALSSSEAAAMARTADEQARLADQECDRATKLYQSGSISKAEYDRTMSQCQTSKSAAEAAKARVGIAYKSLSDATIRAPFSGLVAERFVNVGEYVSPQSRVCTLLEIDPLRLSLTVAESDVPLVKPDQVVDFAVSAYEGETFHGSVKYMGPALRGSSRDLVVEAVVDNHEKKLRPGMFATAHLLLGERPLAVVPQAAVRNDGTSSRVYVVAPAPTGTAKRADERLVQLGQQKDDVVAVLDGVKPGEQVIVNPPDSISDGSKVE